MKPWMPVLLLTFVGSAPLAAQRMPPGYLNEMPAPARVLANIRGSDNLDQTARQKAAFIVLRQMIEELSPRNQLTADEQRIHKSYTDAWNLVPTPHFDEAESRRLGRASPSANWTRLQQDLVLDGAFRNELLDRLFSPAWKSSFLAVEARKDHERQLRRQERSTEIPPATTPAADSTFAPWTLLQEGWKRVEPFLIGFVLVNVGVFMLTLILALRNDSGPRLNVDSKEALRLPDSMRRVRLFRKEYDVSCDSGMLFRTPEIWTETNVTTSGGGTYQIGETVNYTPITTHVRSTVHHRFWLRSTNGQEFSTHFPGDVFSATTGQVISTIDTGGDVLMAYNHSTGQFATRRSWLNKRHKLSYTPWGCWLIPCAALAGYIALASLHGGALTLGWSFGGIVWVFSVFIFWMIPATILNAIITGTRDRQFETRVVPVFRRFLAESTLELLSRFRAPPT
jgi:hypothetical protein